MKKCAVQVVEAYGGVFPRDKALLRKLPGIGEYTAGAVSSIAYDEKNPAVDGNVLRVCARAEGDFTPIDDAGRRKALTEKLAAVYPERAGDYTQSLMELGALVCLPDNPKCGECPLRGHCWMIRRNGNGLPCLSYARPLARFCASVLKKACWRVCGNSPISCLTDSARGRKNGKENFYPTYWKYGA